VTAICGGGTSGPKPGTSAVVLVGSGTIATMLQKSTNTWLQFAAALLTLPELVLSVFCGGDPPAMPTFTSTESNALLNATFDADFFNGLAKFTDLVHNLAWQEYCQCTSGALVVPPPVAPPAGTAIYQTPPPPTSTPCYAEAPNPFALAMGTGNSYAHQVGSGADPITNATAVRITSTAEIQSGIGHHYQWTIFGVTNAGGLGTNIPGTHAFATTGTDSTIVLVPSADMLYFYGTVQAVGTDSGFVRVSDYYMEVFCNGNLPGAQSACCPPDVATQSYLDLILKTVTLMQRQIAPFSYVPGEVHTGCIGNGIIAVSGIIGVKVELTATPARLGTVLGSPDTLYDAGWLNIGTDDGFGPRQFISSNPMLLFPISGAVTVIGYSIPLDVTATITTLRREP